MVLLTHVSLEALGNGPMGGGRMLRVRISLNVPNFYDVDYSFAQFNATQCEYVSGCRRDRLQIM